MANLHAREPSEALSGSVPCAICSVTPFDDLSLRFSNLMIALHPYNIGGILYMLLDNQSFPVSGGFIQYLQFRLYFNSDCSRKRVHKLPGFDVLRVFFSFSHVFASFSVVQPWET